MATPIAQYEPVTGLELADKRILDAKRHVDNFLATLGHEMRNPLSALSAALEVLPAVQLDPVQVEELRGIMLRQVRQLTRLSDDLLDSARIAQGRFQLRQSPIELGQLVGSACEQIRPFIDRCGQSLEFKLRDKPLLVHGDAPRLLQAFANLIQNAAKFTQRAGLLQVTMETESEYVVVRVRDNGRGIAAHRLPYIFASLSPFDASSAQTNDGLGIGLRLVKTIVELHGGTVVVRSDGLNRGAEFTVRLPLLTVFQPRFDGAGAPRFLDLTADILEETSAGM